MTKYGPYLEAAGPAAIEGFFYGSERARNESLATFIAAKEIALQELEAHVGEKLPTKIAGRVLLRHANLTDAQRESLAVRYNSMMTFDQVAAVLRPLDRPDALVQKVNKTYMTASSENKSERENEVEESEEELVADDQEGSEGPESDGEGNLTYMLFDPNLEYNEDEATYIWAYNSAYKDVRRELQARRKGRQFYKSKENVTKKGKTKGSKGGQRGRPVMGQGRGQRHQRQGRGTPDELMAKTRCFNCDQLGHISRECPNREQPSNFYVCQGSATHQNKIYVNMSTKSEKKLSIFAGVRTDSHEAVVDTAAEEAVIGSKAMQRLREALSAYGLKPIEAPGATVSCAGIGGSAKIAGIFDIPIGVAGTNGLIRTTEIQDEGSFETPFLLPISYIELVGGVVDTEKNQFVLRNGCGTSMRRTPSAHRAISILDFARGQW